MRSYGGIVVCVGLLVAGCGGPDPYGPPLENNGNVSAPGGAGSGGGSAQCTGGGSPTLTPLDPSTLPPCGAAVCADSPNAHCVPADKVPANVGAQLAKCSDGASYCVPDSFIKSGGAAPPTCKSLNGADGVCLSVCVPQVKQYESLLPQDSCAADERCAPCINPLTNMPSGACDIGKATGCTGGGSTPPPSAPPPAPMCPYTGPPLIDVSTLPSCGDGAHCVSASLVPAAMASQLASCAAPNTGLCAPDVFIQAGGNYVPKTCASLDNAEGRCLNVVIPQVKAQAAELTQDVCQAFEKCVPCYSPINGMPTGSCALSCDPGPQKPKVVFQDCCKLNNADQGKCVPKTVIPMSLQSNLTTHECTNTDTDLCVPTENLDPNFKPMACTGSTLLAGQYTGVCLSKCLHFGFIQQLGISQGSCDDLHDCAPCTNPLTGQPTGAPGCPST